MQKWLFEDFPHNSCKENLKIHRKHFWRTDVMRIISLYSVRMRENVDQKNSKYGNFWRRDNLSYVRLQPLH